MHVTHRIKDVASNRCNFYWRKCWWILFFIFHPTLNNTHVPGITEYLPLLSSSGQKENLGQEISTARVPGGDNCYRKMQQVCTKMLQLKMLGLSYYIKQHNPVREASTWCRIHSKLQGLAPIPGHATVERMLMTKKGTHKHEKKIPLTATFCHVSQRNAPCLKTFLKGKKGFGTEWTSLTD